MSARIIALVVVASLGGCALLSKSEPIRPRYFSPELPSDKAALAPVQLQPGAEVRIGRVVGVANLEERLIFRDSASEIGYHRDRRWTEAPEQYLRRRLARVLFEERGFREALGGSGPTLDAELTLFEEVRVPMRAARVQVIARLHDLAVVRWEATITVEQPIAAGTAEDEAIATVAAIGAALRAVVAQIADRVALELVPEGIGPTPADTTP